MKSFKALLEERNKAYRAVAVAEAAEEATKRRPELELPQLSKNGLGIKPDYSSKRRKLKKDDKPRAKKVRPQVKYIEINELDYEEYKEGNWDVALYADPTDETTNDAQNFKVAAHDLGVDQSVALFLHSATEKKAWVANFSTLDMKGSGPLSARLIVHLFSFFFFFVMSLSPSPRFILSPSPRFILSHPFTSC
jgi:hypothetical protein